MSTTLLHSLSFNFEFITIIAIIKRVVFRPKVQYTKLNAYLSEHNKYPEFIVLSSKTHSHSTQRIVEKFTLATVLKIKHARSQLKRADGIETFDENVLYRRHANPLLNKYYTLDKYRMAMNRDRASELVRLLHHIRVEKISIVNLASVKQTEITARDVEAHATITSATTDVGAELGNKETDSSESNETNDSLVAISFDPAIYNDVPYPTADVIPESVFPDGVFFLLQNGNMGLGNGLEQVVTTMLEKQTRSTNELEVELAVTDDSKFVNKVQSDLSAVINTAVDVGYTYSKEETTKGELQFKCKYKIKFFERDVYEHWAKLLDNSRTRAHREARRSISSVSSRRYSTPLTDQHDYCLDLAHIKSDQLVVPDDRSGMPCLVQKVSQQVVKELVQDTSLTGRIASCCCAKEPRIVERVEEVVEEVDKNPSTLSRKNTIPVTIYGPKNAGKTSTIATWNFAVRSTAYSFMCAEGAEYASMLRAKARSVTSIFEDLTFDPKMQVYGEGNADPVKLQEDHRVEVRFQDTYPAVDAHSYVVGKGRKPKPLPTGLQVLILDAQRVDGYCVRGATGELINYAEKFCKRLEEVDDVYPPFAILLSKCNKVKRWTLNDGLGGCCEWVTEILGVERVYEMPTFEKLQNGEREKYFAKSMWDKEGIRVEYRKRWCDVALGALNTLKQLCLDLAQHEAAAFMAKCQRDAEERKALEAQRAAAEEKLRAAEEKLAAAEAKRRAAKAKREEQEIVEMEKEADRTRRRNQAKKKLKNAKAESKKHR